MLMDVVLEMVVEVVELAMLVRSCWGKREKGKAKTEEVRE